VVPNVLNYRGAFTGDIKNASRPFEMSESNRPTTRHHIAKHVSVQNSVIQEMEETLESLVSTLLKVSACILIHLDFSVLETSYVVTILIQGFQKVVEKRAPLLVEGTVFQIDVSVPDRGINIIEE
jgi:hypothetical protein